MSGLLAATFADFAQQAVSGLASGGVYALLALALVIIHRSTGVINFAQGEMATLSTYIAWALWAHHAWNFWLAVAGYAVWQRWAAIKGFGASGWVVRDNVFADFWCPSSQAFVAVNFTAGSRDTVIEANVPKDKRIPVTPEEASRFACNSVNVNDANARSSGPSTSAAHPAAQANRSGPVARPKRVCPSAARWLTAVRTAPWSSVEMQGTSRSGRLPFTSTIGSPRSTRAW